MKTNFLLFIALGMVMLVSCNKPRSSEQQTVSIDTPAVDLSKAEADTLPLLVDEPESTPVVSSPTIEEPKTRSTSYTAEYEDNYSSDDDYSSSYSDSSDDDYWEEMRKTSPNDNYLLGFDEDVDDVHDMELYMEDY